MAKLKFPLPIKLRYLNVALYSKSQDCFHIETLEDYVMINVERSILKLNPPDFRLIGIFETGIEANDYIESFRKIKDKETV